MPYTNDENAQPMPHVYLTDDNGTFSTEVWLGKYDTAERWRDATQAEYDEWVAQQEAEIQAGYEALQDPEQNEE